MEVPEADVQTTGDLKAKEETGRHLLYEANLPGYNDPSVPTDQVWYPHEPTWRSIAESRIEFGLSDFSLKLQYMRDFDVTADLAAKAKQAGFSLGGSFEKHKSTTWIIEGTFASNE